jgi:hypothetical protein
MVQIKKEDIIDEKEISEALDRLIGKFAILIGMSDYNKCISDSEIDFIVAANNAEVPKDDIRKVIKDIRKAAKKLKIKRTELHGVYLALNQMVSKGKTTKPQERRPK